MGMIWSLENMTMTMKRTEIAYLTIDTITMTGNCYKQKGQTVTDWNCRFRGFIKISQLARLIKHPVDLGETGISHTWFRQVDPALEDGPGILLPVPQRALKGTSVDVPAQQSQSLGMQRNLHIPLYHIKSQYFGSSSAFLLQSSP